MMMHIVVCYALLMTMELFWYSPLMYTLYESRCFGVHKVNTAIYKSVSLTDIRKS